MLLPSDVQVYIALGYTDMRKSINGLSMLEEDSFQLDLFSGSLFAGTPQGAQASATIYSLIETAKANNPEPYKYLRFLFHNLPFVESEEDYERLLPFNLTEEQLELPVGWSVV